MMAPLATSWVVVVELAELETDGPGFGELEAFGPFSGSGAREQAQTFCDEQADRDDVLSVAVLPMASSGAD